VILTRVAARGPFKSFEVEDEAIQKAASKVMRTGSGKPGSGKHGRKVRQERQEAN
jgi:hypothetical protein